MLNIETALYHRLLTALQPRSHIRWNSTGNAWASGQPYPLEHNRNRKRG